MYKNNINIFEDLKEKEYEIQGVDEFNKIIHIDNHDIFILHLNIRSISGNIILMESLVQKLSLKPTIIICSEAWIPHIKGFLDLNGYFLRFNNNSSINKSDGLYLVYTDVTTME